MAKNSKSFKSAVIETTTRCRLACLRCERTLLAEKEKVPIVDISLDIIKLYAKSDFNQLLLSGSYGDPIYHPKFLDIVDILKSHKKALWISTNGSGKSMDWWDQLFVMLDHTDSIYFAVDGVEDTCGSYRVNFTPKDFNQVLQIMHKGAKQYNLNIKWQFIPFSFNEHQIQAAKQIADRYGIKLVLKKSSRWLDANDPILPKNKELISQYFINNHEDLVWRPRHDSNVRPTD